MIPELFYTHSCHVTGKITLIDVNSTGATRSKNAYLTIDVGQTESMCSAVVLDIHRGVAREEVIDAICQVDSLWGFWEED